MTDTSEKIWFNPPIFWAATQGMSSDEADALLDTVLTLAERRDLNTLRQFNFITIGKLTLPKAS